MLSNHYRIVLFLLILFKNGDANAVVPVLKQIQVETAETTLPTLENKLDQDPPYTDQEVKKAEKLLSGLQGNVDKIKILLKVSDWYEASFNNPETLEKAFAYAEQALRLSRYLHSDIYAGKCYLQFSMLYELRNNNAMIEASARKAIQLLANTNQTDALGESWVMIWSAKMRTHAPIEERLTPIFKVVTFFEKLVNDKRTDDCYKEISELYFSNSDFNKAISFYKSAKLKYDDIYPTSSRLNTIYEAEKRNRDIIRLNSMVIFVVLLLIILGLLNSQE